MFNNNSYFGKYIVPFCVYFIELNKEHKMLHRMTDKVYLLYLKSYGQADMFS